MAPHELHTSPRFIINQSIKKIFNVLSKNDGRQHSLLYVLKNHKSNETVGLAETEKKKIFYFYVISCYNFKQRRIKEAVHFNIMNF